MNIILGKSFRFYRFYYSVFATVSLILIISLQIGIDSPPLWESTIAVNVFAILVGTAGIAIMLACMKKYISAISGIKAFSRKQNPATVLQTDGLHSYTRHPLYFGTLLFIWSLFLLFPLVSNLIACALISVYTVAGIHIEERKLVSEFGGRYKAYARKVPMLVPLLPIRRPKIGHSFPKTV